LSIAEQLTEDMKASMKAGQPSRTSVLRLLRGALKNEEIKLRHSLSEDETFKVLQREAKQRRDSIEAYQTADRTDLVQQEQAELEIISEYLPEAMSEDEVAKVVDEVLAETGASNIAQMGQVMGAVMKRVGAKADGGMVSKLVKEKLS
jgi:uncharacterized protein YqeY